MALELQIITSYEFIRLGAHGELDWPKSLKVLTALVQQFMHKKIDLAIVDVRDTRTNLTDEQLENLVDAMATVGLGEHNRIAILHRPMPPHTEPRSAVLVKHARDAGFDLEEFDSYERAVEWLSAPLGKDPDFERDVYQGPEGQANPPPGKTEPGTNEPPKR